MPNNFELILVLAASILIVIEVYAGAIFGFIFVGLGLLVSAICLQLGLINSLSSVVVLTGLSSALAAAILWKPLKKLNKLITQPDLSSDLIGQILVASETITDADGAVKYSDQILRARLNVASSKCPSVGDSVRVVRVDGTTLFVDQV